MSLFAYQWVEGKLWPNRWSLLFYIPLRHLLNYDTHFHTLSAVIRHECLSELSLLEVEELLSQLSNDRILYLLDGYDEVAVLRQNQEHRGHLLRLLLQQNCYILTSRPYYVHGVVTDRKLENIGFLEQDIIRYIQQFFARLKKSEQVAPLLDLLECNPSIKGIAHIPINLELLCSIWERDYPKTLSTQITVTQLYDRITYNLLWRYATLKLELISTCSSKMLYNSCLPVTNFLEHLAFESIRKFCAPISEGINLDS